MHLSNITDPHDPCTHLTHPVTYIDHTLNITQCFGKTAHFTHELLIVCRTPKTIYSRGKKNTLCTSKKTMHRRQHPNPPTHTPHTHNHLHTSQMLFLPLLPHRNSFETESQRPLFIDDHTLDWRDAPRLKFWCLIITTWAQWLTTIVFFFFGATYHSRVP